MNFLLKDIVSIGLKDNSTFKYKQLSIILMFDTFQMFFCGRAESFNLRGGEILLFLSVWLLNIVNM